MTDSFKVLESVLRPLSYWYNQDNIEEVAINNAGTIWLRLRGKRAYPWVMYKDEKLSKEYSTKASNNESPLLLKGYVSYNQNNDDEYLRKAEIINKLKSPQNTKILQVHNMIQNTKTTKQDIDFDESKDYSGYINEVTNSNKIYTREDVESMTETELQQNKSAIDYQRQTIGIPTNKQAKASGMVFVNGYTRSDGVQVKSYYRTRPD